MLRVLLVNCSEHEREMYAEYLRFLQIDTLEACGVAEALAVVEDFQPTVVVTALDLRHYSDGLDLIRALRANERTHDTAIVVVTGRVFPEDHERATDAGCDVFLPKPLLPDVLAHEVRRAVAARRRHTFKTGSARN